MRITFLNPIDLLTGGARVVALYASQLQARGHEVLVVSNRDVPTSLREHLRALRHGRWRAMRREKRARLEPGHIAQSGVPHHVLDRHRRIVARDLPDADVVVATWWETAVWMHELPASKGRKVHLIQGYETWWGAADARARVQAALRLPNRKIAISSGLKREIEGELGDLGIEVVRNAVDGAQFDAPPRRRGSPPTVGFIYAPDPIKAPDRYLKIIAAARRRLPELRVLAFGAQQPVPGMPLPAGAEFHFRPPQAEIPGLYARCDAWLFATRVDSFGLPLLEAMACRTPVVGVPVGAAPELLGEGAGKLVTEQDEDALAAALADALVDMLVAPEADWQAMADRAHARAHDYTWQDAVARFESLVADPVHAMTNEKGDYRCKASPPAPMSCRLAGADF